MCPGTSSKCLGSQKHGYKKHRKTGGGGGGQELREVPISCQWWCKSERLVTCEFECAVGGVD
jgi:hypothetical protein